MDSQLRMSKFSCKNCNVKFENAEIQRNHYKTDWHHYNLKRKIAALPPVSAEDFKDRLLQIRNAEVNAIHEQQLSLYCNACHKQFSSENSHQNHLKSKKHKENMILFNKNNNREVTTKRLRKLSSQSIENSECDGFEILDDESLDSDDWENIPEKVLTAEDCLFCMHNSENIDENLQHMSRFHSFFIPDQESCIDVEGLIAYLGEKITNHHICLWCGNSRIFHTLDAVRKHMKDKGHCQMQFAHLATSEYAKYYDYTCLNPVTEVGINEYFAQDLRDANAYAVILPGGITLGHRSLVRYYKQHLKPSTALALGKVRNGLHSADLEFRSLGATRAHQRKYAREKRALYAMQRIEMVIRMRRCYGGNDKRHRKRRLM